MQREKEVPLSGATVLVGSKVERYRVAIAIRDARFPLARI